MINTPDPPPPRPIKKPDPRPDRAFVRQQLPWFIAGAALILYLLTLHHWIAFSSMFEVARSNGWIWQPDLSGPLSWLVALSFRIFPLTIRPVALNVFAACCAALTLALLARSVALWPHDRTHEQRQKERGPFWFMTLPTAWLPPLVAALVCGLQLTFWDHATKAASAAPPWGSGCAMLDVLMFAYIVRALLEFRISQKELWLYKAALVYGLATTNNWAMLVYFPLFLAALIWIRGLAFFNVNFLVKMFLWALVGLCVYLILPIAQSSTDVARVPFWAGLRQELGMQKQVIGYCYNILSATRQEQLLLALTSLVPFLLISIRWAAYFGDTSRLGVALTTWAFHIVHAAFFILALWMALDPPFGARSHMLSQAFGLPFLTLSYLSAIVIGYIIGYFLIIFSPPEPPKRALPLTLFVGRVVTILVYIAAVGMPLLLLAKNLPYIRSSNGRFVREFARQLTSSLPQTNAVVLSDDSRRMFLARSEVISQRRSKSLLLLESTPLVFPDYQRYVKKRNPGFWPFETGKEGAPPMADIYVLQRIQALSTTNAVFYLHPSFGYYFELFSLKPSRLDYELTAPSSNSLEAPLLSPETIKQNQEFWSSIDTDVLRPIAQAIDDSRRNDSIAGKVLKVLHVKPEANRELAVLGSFYSRALDYWGVELQKNGQWKPAAAAFESALRLNPDNVVAKVNLQANHDFQSGKGVWTNSMSSNLADEFGRYRNWDDVMSENGPFDEPRFCYQEGITLRRGGLYRQSAQQFARTVVFDPANLPAWLWLAAIDVETHLPDRALKIVENLRANPQRVGLSPTNEQDVLFVETSAYLTKKDLPSAEAAIGRALQSPANQTNILTVAKEVYLKYGYYSNAVDTLNAQLKLSPTNTDYMLSKGYACLQMGDYDQGIATLNHLLTIETNTASEMYSTALLDRGISYLRSGKLEEARKDYETLEKAFPTAFQIKFGLGEVAYRRKDTNAAIRYYQLYLQNAPTNTAEWRGVREKLKEIRPGYPQLQ